ncbi:MAG: 6-bladed beta-propeller [Candidatus Schekmanbacteria bacterium]|nr:6-bladed beta-propeller [Candidatus Schekmanbacteria bacterium]
MPRPAWMALALLLGTWVACATVPTVPVSPALAPAWPAPPEKARIAYVSTIRGPRDLGLRKPFFQRLRELIVGSLPGALAQPVAVAVADDRMAIADAGCGCVHVFDLAKKTSYLVRNGGGAELLSPVGVALGSRGLWIADSARRAVFLIDPHGKTLQTIPELERPTGLAWDAAGSRLFIAETLAHRVCAFTEQGGRLLCFGARGREPGDFNYPTHLTFAEGPGLLLVTDAMNFRVQAFRASGELAFALGKAGNGSGDFSHPKGVAVDPDGNIYVVDALFDRVQIFDHSGRLLLGLGGAGAGPGQFWLPSGIAFHGNRFFVADTHNGRVQVFRYEP